MTVSLKTDRLETLERIFRGQFLNDGITVTETTSPADIEEWDSLAHVSLLAAVEDCFGIRFTVDEMASINSVSGILEILAKRAG